MSTNAEIPKSFYDLSATFKGKTVQFEEFKGKVRLVSYSCIVLICLV